VDNIWPNKIEYSISTPTKAIVFGTAIHVDFKLIPLLKGLRIGQITSQLIESHDLTLNPEDPDSIRNTYKNTRTILTDEHELDEDNIEIIDESAEGYQCTRVLDMPQTLTRCLQDTDTKGIKVRHKLKFRIQLHNPDGHISEVSNSRTTDHSSFKLTFQCSSGLLFQFRSSSRRILPLTTTTTFLRRRLNLPESPSMSSRTKRLPFMASTRSISCIASWIPAATAHQVPAVVRAHRSLRSVATYRQRTLHQ
jgi:hypothetical protein